MAFEITDYRRIYVTRGEFRGLFNVCRSDEASTSPRYYMFLNDEGSYIIQRVTLTDGVGVYDYIGFAKENYDDLDANWTARSTHTYVEYNKIL